MYPGEWEKAECRGEMLAHLRVMACDPLGGRLAYCDGGVIDQSKCSPSRNYKPLDCISYPFFPALSGGILHLLVDDSRCPLPSVALRQHHNYVLLRWSAVLQLDARIAEWLLQLSLDGYRPYK